MKWVALGFQWDCALDPCPAWTEGDRAAGGADTFQNPDRRLRVIAAARRHHERTGHPVIIEQHSRATFGKPVDACSTPPCRHDRACAKHEGKQEAGNRAD